MSQTTQPLVVVAGSCDWARAYPVMAQLRPHLTLEAFLEQVERQTHEGYAIAYVEDEGQVRAVAGFRVQNMLAHGQFLYVDDLVTDSAHRSKGYGDILFDWLTEFANFQNCVGIELDSGVQRFDAHRFYLRRRMSISSHHFRLRF